MHIASTAFYTGKKGYPPTYTQIHTQAPRWILACDRGEGLVTHQVSRAICQSYKGGYEGEHRRTS